MDIELKINTTMDMYLDLMEDTEPPYAFHRWSFLGTVAASLGRDFYLPFGEDIIYPNMYTVLIGSPASRKSTAIKHAGKILEASGYEHFAGSRSSKEKFLEDWQHGFDKIFRGVEVGHLEVEGDGMEALFSQTDLKERISEVFIQSGELEDFLGGGNANFVSMLTNMWDNLEYYSERFKNAKSQVHLPNPTINMLGGATSTSFANIFNSNILGQGMFSRLILVYGKQQRKKLTIPPALDGAKKQEIIKLLQGLKVHMKGPATISPTAMEMLDQIYKNPKDLMDSRLLTYAGRRLTHLLKLCLVIAATECTKVIDENIVTIANTILSYTEMHMPKALGEFGKARNAEVSQTVLDVIIEGHKSGGMTPSEVLEQVGQNVESTSVLGTILVKLQASNKIATVDQYVDTKKGREKVKLLVPVILKYGREDMVDFSALWEHQTREGE